MPIWTVSFCQLLPPPAAKRHRLQAIQLPRGAGAKREQLPAPPRAAGPRPGRAGRRHSPARPCRECWLCLLFFFLVIYCGRLLGTPSLSWKWQQNMLTLLPLPFVCSLAPSARAFCFHTALSWSRLEPLQGWVSPTPDLSPHPQWHPFPCLLPYLFGIYFLTEQRKETAPSARVS